MDSSSDWRPGSFSLGWVAALPAAQHPDVRMQVRVSRNPSTPTDGLGSTTHDVPSHCSTNCRGWKPEPPPPPNEPEDPAAQHRVGPTQATAPRMLPPVGSASGVGTRVQRAPSHASARVCPAVPAAVVTEPTARHDVPSVHVTSDR